MKITQFAAMVLTALTLVAFGAHLFALPNKIHLARVDYFIVQNMYRGWVLFGAVVIGAILTNFALAVIVRSQDAPFLYVVVNLVCLLATLTIFFAFTYPANQATNNWTVIPPNWQQLRWQWEISYAVNGVIAFVGFCSLTLSLLAAKTK